MLRRLLDSPVTYFVAAGVLLLFAVSTQFELAVPSRPEGTIADIASLPNRNDLNVVFIVVDTLRADRMSVYGYERPTTPVLADLAEHGILFENVIAQSSWTKTSMASLWTGTWPARNGIHRYNHVVPDDATLPAEIFLEAGYRTGGIWRNGWVAPNFGFSQGFELYHQPKPGAEEMELNRHSPAQRPLGGTDEDLALSARDFLDNFGQEKFFLYIHMMDTHQYVFDENAPDFGPGYSDAYDKSITWTDRVIASLVQSLDERGVLDRTLIAVCSDHGEAFREHGFEGHARNLYREVTRVPFLIIPPYILDKPIRIDALIGNVDIWPTLLDLVGLPPMPGTDGRSMRPLILEAGGLEPGVPTEELSRPIFSSVDQHWGQGKEQSMQIVSMIDERSRVFVHPYDRALDEFYDLESDPMETRNLAATKPPRLGEMTSAVELHMSDTEAPWGAEAPTVELDALRLNQLKALGYHFQP